MRHEHTPDQLKQQLHAHSHSHEHSLGNLVHSHPHSHSHTHTHAHSDPGQSHDGDQKLDHAHQVCLVSI